MTRITTGRRAAPVVLVLLLVVGALVLAVGGAGPGRRSGPSPGATSSPAGPPSPSAVPVPGATGLPMPAGVLSALPDPAAAAPSPAGLAAALGPMLTSPAFGGAASMQVVDAASGAALFGLAAGTPRSPASTVKILTTTAALAAFGPDAVLATQVVAGAGDQVVLLAGGDQLLSAGAGDPSAVDGHAGLADLAAQVAAALRARGTGTVTVGLDDRLFSGATRSPHWQGDPVAGGYVAPITAVAVHAGRLTSKDYARRSPDPARAAAQAFAARLRAQGITVTGAITRVAAPVGSPLLGEVRSAPVGEVVEYALQRSDNTVAEALARLVAEHAQRPTTFTGAGQAVLSQLAGLGLDVSGAVMVDGSGLARADHVPASLITAALQLAVDQDHPELRAVLTGLPVAGATGTLADRFRTGSRAAAAGLVRAKTGTLTGVSALAGTVVDADGRLLLFALLTDRASTGTDPRPALDAVASRLARCGCRS